MQDVIQEVQMKWSDM